MGVGVESSPSATLGVIAWSSAIPLRASAVPNGLVSTAFYGNTDSADPPCFRCRFGPLRVLVRGGTFGHRKTARGAPPPCGGR